MRALLVATILLAMSCCTPAPRADSGLAHPRTEPLRPRCRTSERAYSRFELVVLGSGGPGGFGRAGSSYAIFLDGVARILVDSGPGAFVRLGEMGVDLSALDIVLLTHLHIDHTGDLPGVVKSRDVTSGESLTFRIFGPVGGGAYPSTTAFVDRMFGARGAFAYLPTFRNALRFTVTDLPAQPDAPVHALVREGNLDVTSIAVDHDDVPAVAYRIAYAGHAVVVSGDLASRNENLTRLTTGADLLVYDTAVLDPPGSPENLYALHTSPRRIGAVAAAAHVKMLLLSHLSPAVETARAEVSRSVRSSFSGETRFAEDCLRIDLTQP